MVMENTQNIKDLVQKFYPYAKNALGFEHPVRVIMRKDAENAEQSLGKTAYYDPENNLIVLYVTNRHPKDILRSFSHELVHHAQNCRGDLDDLSTGGHYAEDGKGREIEKEAYLQGNLNVRDWEDSMKFEGENQMNEHYQVAKEELRKLVAETYKEIMAEKGKYDDGDGKDEKCDYVDCEGEGEKEEKVDERNMDPYDGTPFGRPGSEDGETAYGSIRNKDKKKKPEDKKEIDEYQDPWEGSPFAARKGDRVEDPYDKEKKDDKDGDVKEASYDTMTPEEKKKGIEREERMIAAEEERLKKSLASAESDAQRARAQKIYKRNKEQSEKIIARLKGEKPKPEKEKFKSPRPSRPAYPGDEHFYGGYDLGRDIDGAGNPIQKRYQESKQQEKQVVTEVPQQPKEAKETDRAWYNASLYNKLMSKWTKKGDK